MYFRGVLCCVAYVDAGLLKVRSAVSYHKAHSWYK